MPGIRQGHVDDIERRIVTGLAVSDAYVKLVEPVWHDDLLESADLARIARWCWDHFRKYGKVADTDLGGIFYERVREEQIPKAEAEVIERILSHVSTEYGRGDGFNAQHLFDRTVVFIARRTIEAAAEEAVDAAERGDISAARIAGWRIASVGGPAEKLADPWGDPEPPPFEVELLPPVLRRFARTKAEAIGVGTAPVAWAAIAACSGALDGSIRLQMKRSDQIGRASCRERV